MEKIKRIYPGRDPVAGLRDLADEIEAGSVIAEEIALVTDACDVYYFGDATGDRPALLSVYLFQAGINFLAKPPRHEE